MGGGKSRKMGSGGRHKTNKRLVRGNFNARHIDQVFNDFVKDPKDVHDDKHGPVGTSSKCEPSATALCPRFGLLTSYIVIVIAVFGYVSRNAHFALQCDNPPGQAWPCAWPVLKAAYLQSGAG